MSKQMSFKHVISIVLLIALAVFSVWQVQPPSPEPASAPETVFSAERAMEHMNVIAQKPHPTGSEENEKVRRYLIDELQKLGLTAEVQTTTSSRASRIPGTVYSSEVNNVMARLQGADNSKALLIAAHYDSVPTGPGANDDGVGVAAMLETLRALKADGKQLKNDVIFLFTDGEELGLLGAQAFWDQHPWAKDVGMVVNLEARGAKGASLMFQTSKQNGWIIDEFAEVAPHPFTNSLLGDLYSMLPNDTDMTVSNENEVSGLNFAYGDNWTAYHTTEDSIEDVSKSSLQHHGENALAIARHFGNLDLADTKQSDRVYFSLFGQVFHYSKSFALPLGIVTALLFLAAVIYGVRRRLVSVRGLFLGVLAVLGAIVFSIAVIFALWMGINALWAGKMVAPMGGTYFAALFEIAFVLITLALSVILWKWTSKRLAKLDLIAGGLLLWTLLLIAICVALPGGSYLFTWPLLFALGVYGFALRARDAEGALSALSHPLSLLISAAPLVLLFTPLINLLFIFLPVATNVYVMAMIVLVLALLVPHLELLQSIGRRVLPTASGIIAAGLLIFTAFNVGPSSDRPIGSHIFYALDSNNSKAAWVSIDGEDSYTEQFFGKPEVERLNKLVPGLRDRDAFYGEAPSSTVQPPELTLVDDKRDGDLRTLHVKAVTPRQGRLMVVYVPAEVTEATLNGVPMHLPSDQSLKSLSIRHANLPEQGLDLVLKVKSQDPISISVTDATDQLPSLPNFSVQPRTSDLMPGAEYDQSTLVTKTFQF